MDKTTLVEADLVEGRLVVQALEKGGTTIDVAAWLQDDENGVWRLMISSPQGGETGVRPIYDAISIALHDLGIRNLDLSDFLVASPQEHLVKDLKSRVSTNGELHEIRLDSLGIGNRLFRSSRIYRVVGNPIGHDARVRVKATGQLGTASGVIQTPTGPRYLVMYDLTEGDLRPMNGMVAPISGQDYAEQDLDFLYAVRAGGWPEKNPQWLLQATGATRLTDTAVANRPGQ